MACKPPESRNLSHHTRGCTCSSVPGMQEAHSSVHTRLPWSKMQSPDSGPHNSPGSAASPQPYPRVPYLSVLIFPRSLYSVHSSYPDLPANTGHAPCLFPFPLLRTLVPQTSFTPFRSLMKPHPLRDPSLTTLLNTITYPPDLPFIPCLTSACLAFLHCIHLHLIYPVLCEYVCLLSGTQTLQRQAFMSVFCLLLYPQNLEWYPAHSS